MFKRFTRDTNADDRLGLKPTDVLNDLKELKVYKYIGEGIFCPVDITGEVYKHNIFSKELFTNQDEKIHEFVNMYVKFIENATGRSIYRPLNNESWTDKHKISYIDSLLILCYDTYIVFNDSNEIGALIEIDKETKDEHVFINEILSYSYSCTEKLIKYILYQIQYNKEDKNLKLKDIVTEFENESECINNENIYKILKDFGFKEELVETKLKYTKE